MRAPAGQRGFSLLEMMTALTIAGITSATIFSTVIAQHRVYAAQLEFSQSQQSARAALSVVQRFAREAGWGVAKGLTRGLSMVGTCNNGADPDACNGIDGGSDRLRIFAGRDESHRHKYGWQPGHSLFRIGKSDEEDCARIPALAEGTLVLISGPCVGGGSSADLAVIVRDVPDGNWCHKYNVDNAFGGNQLSCDYDSGFTFSAASAVDFYVDRSDPDHPRLMLDQDGPGASAPLTLAENIEDLQVSYGLDTFMDDGVPDVWCDSLLAGECNSGLASAKENQDSVTALRIAIVARTSEPRAGQDAPALTVHDHTIPGGDGHRRWVYRATVALRNLAP